MLQGYLRAIVDRGEDSGCRPAAKASGGGQRQIRKCPLFGIGQVVQPQGIVNAFSLPWLVEEAKDYVQVAT